MKINPVYRQETKVSARSFRLPLVILVCNSVLALAGLLDMYFMVSQVKATAEIQYSGFLSLYLFVAAIEFTMLLLIVPALTAGSISWERERQTLNLLLTTPMTAGDIVAGKLTASLSTVFLLIISSFPILSLVFIYGGVTAADIAMVLFCFSSTALLASCIGLCCSCVFKKTTMATAVSYCVMAVLVFGTFALSSFISSFGKAPGQRGSSGTGPCWLLLGNPAASFAMIIKKQVGGSRTVPVLLTLPYGMTEYGWVMISMTVQILMAVLCLWIAVRRVNPRRKKGWKM